MADVGAPFDRIRALLALIREWCPNISFLDFVALVNAARKLYPFPDLADEAGCRQWARNFAAFLDETADLTTTTWDDTLVAQALGVIDDDASWGAIWGIVEWITGGSVADELRAAEKVGAFNFEALMALIKSIIDFINSWKG